MLRRGTFQFLAREWVLNRSLRPKADGISLANGFYVRSDQSCYNERSRIASEFSHNVLDVKIDGILRDAQDLRDLPRRFSFNYPSCALLFSFR
jgi:hypothetical protein